MRCCIVVCGLSGSGIDCGKQQQSELVIWKFRLVRHSESCVLNHIIVIQWTPLRDLWCALSCCSSTALSLLMSLWSKAPHGDMPRGETVDQWELGLWLVIGWRHWLHTSFRCGSRCLELIVRVWSGGFLVSVLTNYEWKSNMTWNDVIVGFLSFRFTTVWEDLN